MTASPFTPREREILDEHLADWEADAGRAIDLGELEELLAERIREAGDEPALQSELRSIARKYAAVRGLSRDDHPLLLPGRPVGPTFSSR